MDSKEKFLTVFFVSVLALFFSIASFAQEAAQESLICEIGILKPQDSRTPLKKGDTAPDFTLPSINRRDVSLKDYRGKKNVVISFIPAAWTPVCSRQWPGYHAAETAFAEVDTIILGISADNIPTLSAWSKTLGDLWFPVLSDFWPHGKVASAYGVLRSNGTSERAIFAIDKQGIIRYIDVHDINEVPPIDTLIEELKKIRESK